LQFSLQFDADHSKTIDILAIDRRIEPKLKTLTPVLGVMQDTQADFPICKQSILQQTCISTHLTFLRLEIVHPCARKRLRNRHSVQKYISYFSSSHAPLKKSLRHE